MELANLVRRGLVQKIFFGAPTAKDLKGVATAIGFPDAPAAALESGGANILYTASQGFDPSKDE